MFKSKITSRELEVDVVKVNVQVHLNRVPLLSVPHLGLIKLCTFSISNFEYRKNTPPFQRHAYAAHCEKSVVPVARLSNQQRLLFAQLMVPPVVPLVLK